MALSNDLISQFVKATKEKKTDKGETTVYGTIVAYDGSKYIRIDGSDLLTPIETTTDVQENERVTALIKNHSVIVTGNVSSPAARVEDVSNLVTDNITVKEKLSATEGSVSTLESNYLTVNETLTANTANIEDLQTKTLTVEIANATYATIEKLDAVDARVYNLESTYGDFSVVTTDRLEAVEASIIKLESGGISTETLDARYAKVVDLDAVEARIDTLEVGVADIDTLIFGSATGTTIQTSFSNSVIAQLGNAQIKSAMIESIAASKITSGDIITNNVRVKSSDGSLVISDETMQISDDNRVRVQIGKDASGDYSINIWDQNGNLMFSKGGITDSAIKNAIIRNDMVSDTANIAAHKLDIDSLFEEINGSTNTIKSTQIYIDDKKQTLNVAFKSLSDTVTSQGNTLTSQGTQISTIQGQITSKIWQQDINTATSEMSTQYSSLEQDLTSFKTVVGTSYATKTDLDNIAVGGRNLFGFNKGIVLDQLGNYNYATDSWDKENKGFSITTLLDAPKDMIIGRLYRLGFNGVEGESYTFSATVSSNIEDVRIAMDICDQGATIFDIGTTPQKISFSAIPVDHYDSSTSYNGFVDITVNGVPMAAGTILYFKDVKIERGNVATDWTPAPEDLTTDDEMSALETRVTQTENSITSVANRTTVVEDKFGLYSTTTQMNSTIEQKAGSILSTVEAVENTVNNLEVGGRNLLMKTGSPVTAPEATEFTSREKSVLYTLHPDIIADPKAFLLSIENSCLAFSFDINVPAIYKNTNLSLNRVGGYFTVNFTNNTTGVKTAWYGTHSSGISASNNTFGNSNSLINVTATSESDTQSFIAHYAGYCEMSKTAGVSILKAFYEDPDNFTVTFNSACVEIKGYTTGGTISNVKLEVGNKPTRWSPAPEDTSGEINKLDSRMTTVEQTTEGLTVRITDAETNVTNAAKTATNYLNYSTSGLVVGDMTATTLGKNVRISSSTVDIREGSTTLASFGADTIYLGKNSETAVINLCNGSATMRSVDDSDFKIYTDKRLVMSAYSSALLDCYRDSTHMTRISMQSADPDATYMWGGISFTIYQDTIKNTFDMSGNTVEFKVTDGTSETITYTDETKFKIQSTGSVQLNTTNGLYVGYDGDYAAKVTLGYKMLQDKSIRWYWSDNALHDGISNNNGQATYIGPGDIGETTTTYIRGKYVRLYAHSGGAVYLGASGSTAVTSDRNLKNDILDIDDKYLDFFDRLRPITYKYNVGHRDHVGFIAQEVEEALIASGLTTEQFAGLVIEKDVTLNPDYDSGLSDEEKVANETHYDTLYSLRYEEFISLLVKKVQSLQEQINQLRVNT